MALLSSVYPGIEERAMRIKGWSFDPIILPLSTEDSGFQIQKQAVVPLHIRKWGHKAALHQITV